MLAFTSSVFGFELQGKWQPSYAYNGKIPWYNGTLIVEESTIRFETKGVVKETWTIYESKNSIDAKYKDITASNSRLGAAIFRFELNEKYKCKKKSSFSYDKNCTDRDQKSPFRLLICSSYESIQKDTKKCKVKERYYDFDSNLTEKLDTGEYL